MRKSKGSSPATHRALRPKTVRRPIAPESGGESHQPSAERSSASLKEATTKRRGELAELAFIYKAASLGFGVAKPYGDSERYDFILDSRDMASRKPPNDRSGSPSPEPGSGRLWRVQVKSTTTLLCGLYRINAHRRIYGSAVPYLPSEVDFLVAYVIPEEAWFIFPIHDILDRTSLLLSPRNWPRPNPTDPYREAWHLLRGG
jgi:PD-(D/E)XK endonuclease